MAERPASGLPLARGLDACRALFAAKPSATVLIDGRAGAGKSTFATAVVARTGATLVRMDDLYPGWDGLAAAGVAVFRDLLAPRASGRDGVWRRWDWAADAPAGRVRVPASAGLVVEGCGSITRATRPLADLTIWLDLDDGERHRRAIDRDGAVFEANWERWAAQERRAIATEHPIDLAHLRLDAG